MKPPTVLSPARTAHELFAFRAPETPESVALEFRDRRVTYAELSGGVRNLARELDAQSMQPGRPLAVFLESGPEAVIALLGCLASGRPFVPIDSSYPEERCAFILHDTETPLVLTARALAGKLPAGLAGELILDELSDDESTDESPPRTPAPNDPACILYTSGSTGRPKGVIRPHSAITARLAWVEYEADDVFCHNMSLNVGFSQERLCLPLMLGLPLVLIPREEYSIPRRFVRALERHGVTQLTLTPHTLRQILDLGPDVGRPLQSLRSVAVGGSALTPALTARFRTLLPHVRLVNAYGSTESGSAIRGSMDAESPPALLGRPVAGARVKIVDADFEPCEDGTIGEIAVGGPGIAIGYLNDPALTAEKFVTVLGERMYRTGDRGRYLADGSIEFLGRLDRQVKIRGFRVEPDEVEKILIDHPSVREAFVGISGTGDQARLAAWIAPKAGGRLSAEVVRGYLGKHLPEYMLPAIVSFVESLPRTLNGKVDAHSLRVPHTNEDRAAGSTPDGPVETAIAGIWAARLGLETVGRGDDFAALGGDSLDTISMITRVEHEFDVEISPDRLPTPLTVSRLASIVGTLCDEPETSRIERRPPDADPPLSFLQEARLFTEAMSEVHARPYDQGRTGLILEIEGALDLPVLHRALREIVRRHEALRASFVAEVSVAGLRTRGLGSLTPELLRSPLRPQIRFRQFVDPEAAPLFEHVRIDHLDGRERESELAALMDRAIHSEFDYESAPLMKAAVLTTGRDRHVLVIAVSHLVCDGWSLEILHREISALYEAFAAGEPDPLPGLRVHFPDFAAWQRRTMDGPTGERLVTYWKGQHERFRPLRVAELAISHPARPGTDLTAGHDELGLAVELMEALRQLAREHRVTLFVLMLSAFAFLLRHYSGRDEFGVITFVANRTSPALEHVVGWFAAQQMIGVATEKSMTFQTLLAQVHDRVMEARMHQGLPSPILAKHLRPMSDASGDTSPPVTLEMRRYAPVPSPRGLTMRRIPLIPRTEMEGGLRVWITDREEATTLTAVYRKAWVDSEGAVRLLADFRRVLERVVMSADLDVSAGSLVEPSPRSAMP